MHSPQSFSENTSSIPLQNSVDKVLRFHSPVKGQKWCHDHPELYIATLLQPLPSNILLTQKCLQQMQSSGIDKQSHLMVLLFQLLPWEGTSTTSQTYCPWSSSWRKKSYPQTHTSRAGAKPSAKLWFGKERLGKSVQRGCLSGTLKPGQSLLKGENKKQAVSD